MNLSPAFFIISAARDNLDDSEIAGRTDTLLRQLQGVGYASAPCKGLFGGRKEPCVIVIDENPGTPDCAADVMRLARVYRQDSVLAVDCNRAARLLFCDARVPLSLGVFISVSQGEAEAAGDYTERDGRFYICEPIS